MTLSESGRLWRRGAFGREPVESEIAAAARRHRSVSHGVAILEAAHHLAAAGYAVDDDPQGLLADDAAPWHVRAGPDLEVLLKGELSGRAYTDSAEAIRKDRER